MKNNEVSKGSLLVKKILATLLILFIVIGNIVTFVGGEIWFFGLVPLLFIPQLIKVIKEPIKKD